MRLFVGVRLDDPVISAAQAAAHALKTRLAGQLKIRWLDIANHVLHFRKLGHSGRMADGLAPR